MRPTRPARVVVICSSLAMLMTAAACGRSSESGHEGAPITLTGCLQQSGGVVHSYVLTTVNEPTTSVGGSGPTTMAAKPETSGSTGTAGTTDPGVVAREQRRVAWHAYRVTADAELEPYLGKQIRVTGRFADTAALKSEAGADRNPPDARGDTAPPEIDEDDLGRVHATSIDVVADACGDANQSGGEQNSGAANR
ncbi:MAG: hypothetical protein AB7N65_14135 [Vicinamibacterales bacterium]